MKLKKLNGRQKVMVLVFFVLATIAVSNPPGWEGPPAPLFYLLARSDAVDAVYGTPEGFERLGIPYMAHIAPPRAWS